MRQIPKIGIRQVPTARCFHNETLIAGTRPTKLATTTDIDKSLPRRSRRSDWQMPPHVKPTVQLLVGIERGKIFQSKSPQDPITARAGRTGDRCISVRHNEVAPIIKPRDPKRLSRRATLGHQVATYVGAVCTMQRHELSHVI